MTTTSHTSTRSRVGSGSDFADLRRRIEHAGLLRRRPGYYAFRGALVLAGFVLGWSLFVAIGDSWWTVLATVVLAVVFGQAALLAHDVAHRQVFRTRRPSELAGRLLGNLGIGMSYSWWQDKHTRHHANPNHEDLDPDVAPDLLVWSAEQAREARGPARLVGRYQAWLFFPLLTLEALNLHVSSVRAVLRPGMRDRLLEAGLLVLHAVLYLGLVLAVLSPARALVFVLVHQALLGVYLGCSFAPNHKGMPTITGGPEPDFLRKQVLTSRNVRGGLLTDVALGGLNYQIEHHLFPSMPCPNLRAAQPIVREFCAERGVAYEETGLVESYRIALRHLHTVGAPLRSGR